MSKSVIGGYHKCTAGRVGGQYRNLRPQSARFQGRSSLRMYPAGVRHGAPDGSFTSSSEGQ